MFSRLIAYDSLQPQDCSPPGYSVHGIFQIRILEWIAITSSPPGDIPNPGVEPTSPALAGGFFTTVPLGKPRNIA